MDTSRAQQPARLQTTSTMSLHPLEKTSNNQDLTKKWAYSLKFKLAVGLSGLFVVLASANLGLIWFQGNPLLVSQSTELNSKISENIVMSLSQQFKQAETLTKDLANLSETLPPDDDLYHTIVPRLLNLDAMQSVIAGGGIWPQPFTFNKKDKRHSFFWGRNQQGQLEFYNDYNQQDGPGYHNEEWYVPAILTEKGTAYWSRSYTDPYSLQPMVTCSVPIYMNDKIAGVTTVDLKLEGLNTLVKRNFENRAGYAFVVDRNNKFITFPDPLLVKTTRKTDSDADYTDFIYVNELALVHPVFQPLAQALNKLVLEKKNLANKDSNAVKILATKIDRNSYQIEAQEARIIAHNLKYSHDDTIVNLANFDVDNDLILRTPANVSIYQMPHTFWKIVTVFPKSNSHSTANNISKSITWSSLGIILLWGILLTAFIWRVFFTRLNNMTQRIKESANSGCEIPLKQEAEDELGEMAHWYNHRTQQLHQAIEETKKYATRLQSENNEHRITSQLLEKSLSMQKAILDSAPLAIISLDIHGLIINCNASTTKMLGYDAQDLIGKTFPYKMIDGNQLSSFRTQHYPNKKLDNFKLFSSHPEKYHEHEWRFNRKTLPRLDVLLTVTPIAGKTNQVEGWLAVAADISEQKAAERQLIHATDEAKRSNSAKTQFLASMSHELRTPLNAIMGFTKRLQKKLSPTIEDTYQDALDTIERNTRHLMSLINDLLDLSKIEAGKLQLDITEFDARDLLEEIHCDTQALSETLDGNYLINLPDNPVYLEADRGKLKQIVINLISNAFKATESGFVKIRLEWLHDQEKVIIWVSDSGKGITPEDQRLIFDKFNNINHYVGEKISTGLGLFITQQLVHLHNGNISFESTTGTGTEFQISLPRKQPKPRQQPEEE